MMGRDKPRRTTQKPANKRYTVVFQCVDPVQPVQLLHTNRVGYASQVYKVWYQAEVDATAETGAVGGEWDLTLYAHTPISTVEAMVAKDRPEYAPEFVYAVFYPGAEVLESCSYMDLLRTM